MLKEYQETIIILLERLELEMANLYKLFADKFPQYQNMWIAMSQQEIDHADKLRKLGSLAKESRDIFDEKMTKTYTVKKVLEVIKGVHTRAEANELTLINALSESRCLEESIIEKAFYNYFVGRDPDTKYLINDIKNETHEHQAELKSAWEKERNMYDKQI